MPISASRPVFFRRWRRLILVLAGLYGLWLLVGFFVIPRVLKGRIERFAAERLHRRVTLRQLQLDHRLHCLLSLTIDLAVLDMKGLTIRVELDGRGALPWLLTPAKGDPERIFQVREGHVPGAVVGFALK